MSCIQQSRVVTEPLRSQRDNMLCSDLDSLPAHCIFAFQAWLDLGRKGLARLPAYHKRSVGARVLK